MEFPSNSRTKDYLHIFTLCAFAISQPIFNLLSGSPEFFIANHSSPGDVIWLTLTLLVFVPSAILIIEACCGALHKSAYSVAHSLFIFFLVALIALPVLKGLEGLSDPGIILGAGFVSTAATLLLYKSSAARNIVSLLSISLLVFPAYFLFLSPIKTVLFPNTTITGFSGNFSGNTNIVMVVFDELPLISLMNNDRTIDPVRYPNFSKVAEESSWYRNATTVSSGTLRSLPAILTGTLPIEEHRLPTEGTFPKNLFTFLGDSHHLNIWESVTSICPSRLCPEKKAIDKAGFVGLSTDIVIIYLHIVTPEGLASGLPDINQNWGNFLAGGEKTNSQPGKTRWLKDVVGPWQKNNDEVQVFRDFIASIDESHYPSLNYIHVLLPHVPFRYLPSGRRYRGGLWAKSSDNGKHSNDTWLHEWAAARHYQQSLLQLGYVDRLLGELVTTLKSSGIWDETLLIITSDHGASYRVNDKRRNLTDTNYMNLLPVIMLIKLPGQSEGMVTDQNVETIDILPTIADILQTPLPFEVDGISMLKSDEETKPTKSAYSKEKKALVFFDPLMEEKYESLEYQTELLGSGSDPIVIYGLGLRRDLLGETADSSNVRRKDNVEVEIDKLKQFKNLELTGSVMPVRITGRVQPDATLKAPFDIAIAINGVIRAVGRTYLIEDENEFSIIVPEDSFHAGQNDIEAFVPMERSDT